MMPYRSSSGKKSGVTGFQIEIDGITVAFGPINYVYTNSSAGGHAIEEMKRRAIASRGLSTYIAQNNPGYTYKY